MYEDWAQGWINLLLACCSMASLSSIKILLMGGWAICSISRFCADHKVRCMAAIRWEESLLFKPFHPNIFWGKKYSWRLPQAILLVLPFLSIPNWIRNHFYRFRPMAGVLTDCLP